MCEISEWLGLLSMSPYEQWQLGIGLVTVAGVIFGVMWAYLSWRLTKKIEFQITVLQNMAMLIVEWKKIQHSREKSGEGRSKEIDEYIERFETDERNVLDKKLGFSELRDLSMVYHAHASSVRATIGSE